MVIVYVKYLAQCVAYECAKSHGCCHSIIIIVISTCEGSLVAGSVVKNLPANAGDTDLIPGSKITWRRKWQPTCLRNPIDRGACRATVSPGGHKELDMT